MNPAHVIPSLLCIKPVSVLAGFVWAMIWQQIDAIDKGSTGPKLREEMESIRGGLNPHPAGQKTLNVPFHAGEQVKSRVCILTGP